MDISAANLDIIFRSAANNFQSTLDRSQVIYPEISTPLPVTTRQFTQAFLDRVPMLRKWIGNRVVHSAFAHSRTINIEPYEHTLSLSKWDIIDDQLGLFALGVKMQAEAAAKHPDLLLWEFIKIAATASNPNAIGYDGVPVYSTAHPLLGGVAGGLPAGAPATQSNLSVSTALTWENYNTVRSRMLALKGADGAPMGVRPNVIMVPPNLETTARQIVEASFRPVEGVATAPAENTLKGTATVLVNQWASDWPNNWWLLDTSSVVKPFATYELTPSTFTYLTNPGDANVFNAAEYLYGVERRAAVSESMWFLSYAATSEAAYIHV
jgi:phage major head subunit gpT-like protein